jgi:hypothetical protein
VGTKVLNTALDTVMDLELGNALKGTQVHIEEKLQNKHGCCMAIEKVQASYDERRLLSMVEGGHQEQAWLK